MLVPVHNLQVCDIDLSAGMWITDDDLRALRGVWPLLRTFRFKWGDDWRSSYPADKVPTFNGAIDFIRDHPRLRGLKLSALDMGLPDESRSHGRSYPRTCRAWGSTAQFIQVNERLE